MVDGLGTDLALSGGRRPGSGVEKVRAVEAAWHHAFSEASWVVLTPKNALRIPWTPHLVDYFLEHFVRVLHGYGFTLYKRVAP